MCFSVTLVNMAGEGVLMLWNAKNGSVLIQNTQMSYVSFGHGPHTLIILPGLSDGLATVEGKALLLAQPYSHFFDQYTVYMFSRRENLPAGHTIRDMATDQAEALQTLGIKNTYIMGVSQGGMIAQWLAIDHPELAGKLVLAVTAPRVNNIIRDSVAKWINLAEQGKHKELMIDTAEKSYSPAYLHKYRKAYPVLGLVGKPKSYERFLINARAILGFDAYDRLEEITAPTLIIGGGDDKIVGVMASYELHEQITGSELFVYPGLGHAAYEEAKDFNRRVFDFLG